MWILAFFACAGEEPVGCADGFELRADGLCYELATDEPDPEPEPDPTVPDESLEAVLAALPECVGGPADGRIDLAAGCVDGVCPGMTFAEISAALGEAPSCYLAYTPMTTNCVWPTGVGASFDDVEEDTQPDADARPKFGLEVLPPFDGGTADGLSIGATMPCFVDALGMPDAVEFGRVGDAWMPIELRYDGEIAVYDWYGVDWSEPHPDGKADILTILPR